MAQSLHIGFYGPFTNLPFGGCAMYFDHKVFPWLSPARFGPTQPQIYELRIDNPFRVVNFGRGRPVQGGTFQNPMLSDTPILDSIVSLPKS